MASAVRMGSCCSASVSHWRACRRVADGIAEEARARESMAAARESDVWSEVAAGLHRCACLVSRRLSGFACLEEGDKFGVNFHGCCQESGNLDDEAFFVTL